MSRIITIFSILILISCKNEFKFQEDGIEYSFSENISNERAKVIAKQLAFRIKETGFKEFEHVDKVDVDSLPYEFMLNIRYRNNLKPDSKEIFEGFAAILSEVYFDNIPIHMNIFDIDDTSHLIRFNPRAMKDVGDWMTSSITSIESSSNVPPFSLDGLELVLMYKLDQLYKSNDTLQVSVDMKNDTVYIDFKAPIDQLDLDSVKFQFNNFDAMLFYALFGNKTIISHLKDSGDNKTRSVFTLNVIK